MKTIKEINEHWWYRLLKIFYVLIALFFVIAPVVGAFNVYGPQFDKENSYIKCTNEEQKEFSLKNYPSISSSYIGTTNDQTFRAWCATEPITVDGTTQLKKLDNYEVLVSSKNYTFEVAYTDRDWFATILFSFLSIAVAVLSFEFIRRAFYYVVLGSIRPPKE